MRLNNVFSLSLRHNLFWEYFSNCIFQSQIIEEISDTSTKFFISVIFNQILREVCYNFLHCRHNIEDHNIFIKIINTVLFIFKIKINSNAYKYLLKYCTTNSILLFTFSFLSNHSLIINLVIVYNSIKFNYLKKYTQKSILIFQ